MPLTCCDCGGVIARNGTRGRNPKRCRQCRNKSKAAYAKATPRPKRKSQPAAVCANEACRKAFYGRPKKQIYCCRKCAMQRFPPARACRNPRCGNLIQRHRQGHGHTSLGKDFGKYCCHKCYCDHRWGIKRPATGWSEQSRKSASASALRTSLRKKCKLLDVPDDPECTRLAVCERDGWECQLCGVACNREYVIDPITRRPDPKNAEHDHIIATTTPGSPGNVFPNSQCLCRKCNNKKRARSIGQMRLDLEGSVKRWESGARGRRRRNSKSSEAIQAAAL